LRKVFFALRVNIVSKSNRSKTQPFFYKKGITLKNQQSVRLSTADAMPEKSLEASVLLIPTHMAAKMLMRTKGTLLNWACNKNGLLEPVRVGRKLGWSLLKIEAILAGKSAEEVKNAGANS
jgi:hypothetical protein